MVRKLPVECPEVPANAFKTSGNWKCHTYQISLITPLFGGGPVPGENDPVTLIRGASIRGNLRFWWRATRGAHFENVKELRAREGEVWGTASSPSQVIVKTGNLLNHTREDWRKLRNKVRSSARGVIDFIVRENIKSNKPIGLSTSVTFNLEISWLGNDSLKDDVKAAVWAWVNFGGLGSRTRRGCGSLYCRELSPTDGNTESLKNWYKQRLESYSELHREPRAWPTLPDPDELLIKENKGQGINPLAAWAKSVEVLQNFRQKPGIGRRRKSDGKPGRSFWPEADSLRRLTGQSCSKHRQPTTTRNNAFPRAEFGLPIVFHFKDGPPRGNDPVGCELLPPCDLGRMASPLILKPLAVRPDQAVSIILPLRTNLPGGVTVKYTDINNKETKKHFGYDYVRGSHLAAYPNSPLKFASSSGSALEAFLEYARSKEGFS